MFIEPSLNLVNLNPEPERADLTGLDVLTYGFLTGLRAERGVLGKEEYFCPENLELFLPKGIFAPIFL
jgi:hypothetical protein